MKEGKVSLIDGRGGELAPRPTRTGLTQLVYDVLDAWGTLDFSGIIKNLPAAISEGTQVFPRKRLRNGLYNGVYTGYFIHIADPKHPSKHRATVKGSWRIAPLSYYEKRQAHIKECRENAVPRHTAETKRGGSIQTGPIHRPLDRLFVIAVGLIGVVVGFVVGTLFGVFIT